MKIKSFDREAVRQLRDFLDEELQVLAETLGVQIKLGNAKFTSANVTFKLEAAIVGESGIAETKQVSDFKVYASRFGLQPDDLGRKFSAGGTAYEIVGLAVKSRQYPILARNEKGKVFKFAPHTVRPSIVR